MSSVLLMLALHQDVQAALIQEIRDVFPDDQDLDSESVSRLKYLDLVLKETMRLFPIAPIIGRKLTADLKLDGVENLISVKKTSLTVHFQIPSPFQKVQMS